MAAPDRRLVQQELQEPDPFFEAVEQARDYYEKNRARVLAVAAGVVAVVVTVTGTTSWYTAQGERAASDFAAAVSSLELDSPSAAEAALKNLGGLSNAGPYKGLAALYRGSIASDAGRHDEALAAYDEFLASPPSEYARQIGWMGKAAALEGAGRDADAAAALDQAAGILGPYRKQALLDRARLAEKGGDKAAALANLQKALEIEGSGPGASSIERRMAALK